jgi:hypothetical protein
MKLLLFALFVVSAFGGLSAQKPVWQPSPGHTQVPIWPGPAPDPQPVRGPENSETSGKDFLPGGRPAVGVNNVTRPTMTVYSPPGKNTGAAVIVFPGGGYQTLAINLEGTEVCDWLTPRGNHVCAVEVPRDRCGTLSEIRAVSRITDGPRRCAEDCGAGPLKCEHVSAMAKRRSPRRTSRIGVPWYIARVSLPSSKLVSGRTAANSSGNTCPFVRSTPTLCSCTNLPPRCAA